MSVLSYLISYPNIGKSIASLFCKKIGILVTDNWEELPFSKQERLILLIHSFPSSNFLSSPYNLWRLKLGYSLKGRRRSNGKTAKKRRLGFK